MDAITLANELEERGELEQIGGTARVAELAALVSATANVEHYARIVKETATCEGSIRAGQEIARLGRERVGETSELVDQAEQIVFDLSQERVRAISPTSGRSSPRASSGSRSSTRQGRTSPASRAASASSTGSRRASSRATS